ncbi:hypothetical protein [Taklimakanibacter albus]|uniref:Uncharacterized protein n=1 Tax=Taklimakanibacter albus TaxID=2800327 RepID=A0ACC5R9W1_9HYPH|nr:hypothetical protein [Aestuariivirga sp. YIM B02566]MBK1869427.1 hypothetical protein [Aestuariivirga sp. YIM B02566]
MAEDGKLMGFGIFEGVWRTITGTVVGSTEVDLGNDGVISLRLKRKDDLLYAVLVSKSSGGTHYYPMDMSDLRNFEAVLRATKMQLEPLRLDELARESARDMMRLGILERIWRRVIDTPLWREDVRISGGAKISFRIRNRLKRRFEIVVGTGEATAHMRAGRHELELLEEALVATRTAIESSRNPAQSAVV